jgi:hypothetical protein
VHRTLIFVLCLVASVTSGCDGDRVDRRFDTHVADPTYAADGPRVLFDEAHRNWHSARGSYRPFVELLESDGYRVARSQQLVDAELLSTCDILAIVTAVGANDANDDDAFSTAECDAIERWVSGGGGLLLVTDHYPSGDAVESLAARFGVQLSKGQVEDPQHFDADFESTHLIFSRVNGGLAAHPICDGKSADEALQRVLSFTGQAVFAPATGIGFLQLSATALARPAKAQVERRGDDVIVRVEYGDPESAAGWAQGVALEHGDGRVVVLGEAAMLSARLREGDARPIGMNTPGYDNRQLALNLMHWLSRAI